DANHTSAQPWLSVMEALDEVVTAIEARQVPGDKVGLLFFDSQVYWSRAIRLTDNFDYIHSVLDLPSMRGEVSFNQGDPPRWVQLGLFPSAAMYTDALVGLKGAFEMIALADDKVPAINNIIMITDGLSTCRPNPYGCDSSYEFYSDSMLALRNLTEKQIFSEKIALHVIQAGQQALPHFLGVQQSGENEETGNGECLTDEMARLKGWQLVRGEDPPIDNYYMGQEAWVNRFDGGFPQATADWHALATTTGGVYVPVRPVVANCTPADPDTFCDSFTTNYKVASRITTDPYCRNTRDQVSSAMIEKILKDSIAKSFTVVETEGS
ncbi:MAG: VWA domain-containing protein, partial [Bdellovibrionales bacterium]|nr:VWA domain-containing protein [Bdellovibrionales bacterium]